MMKKIKSYIFVLGLAMLVAGSCDKFKDALNTSEIELVSITIKLQTTLELSSEPLSIVLENSSEGVKIEKKFNPLQGVVIDKLIPGTYNIVISGITEDKEGNRYFLSGSKIRRHILKDGDMETIAVGGARAGDLIFKEVYYCGSTNWTTNGIWFRDQFYEFYNNSQKIIYLDGIHFANLEPSGADAGQPAIWPAEDGEKYVYAQHVWKFPGKGRDFPLAPGESAIVAQYAVNHKLPLFNPDSPVDLSKAEFEATMNSSMAPAQLPEAYRMVYVYNYANATSTITGFQWLVAVGGGAYVIFSPKPGDNWDPVGNPNWRTRNLATTSSAQSAKIPIEYVLDAVEFGSSEAAKSYKRVRGVLDAGMVYMPIKESAWGPGNTYIGHGAVRKKVGENADGTPIIQDTNNSTEDFIRVNDGTEAAPVWNYGLVPQIRRFGAKMPSWSWSLQ